MLAPGEHMNAPALGVAATGRWMGWTWKSRDPIRRACLDVTLSINYIRILFTEFVFLKRGLSWTEVFPSAPWMLRIYPLLAIFGMTNPRALDAAAGIALVLF